MGIVTSRLMWPLSARIPKRERVKCDSTRWPAVNYCKKGKGKKDSGGKKRKGTENYGNIFYGTDRTWGLIVPKTPLGNLMPPGWVGDGAERGGDTDESITRGPSSLDKHRNDRVICLALAQLRATPGYYTCCQDQRPRYGDGYDSRRWLAACSTAKRRE